MMLLIPRLKRYRTTLELKAAAQVQQIEFTVSEPSRKIRKKYQTKELKKQYEMQLVGHV